jgi:hypothetical protein
VKLRLELPVKIKLQDVRKPGHFALGGSRNVGHL